MEQEAQGLTVTRVKNPGAPSMRRILPHGWDTTNLVPHSFYEHPPEQVAPRLLGKILVHRAGNTILAGRIVEVEAYLGPHNSPPDPAAHSYRGPTPRNEVIFTTTGHAYVYSIYGRYFCLNVTCEPPGRAGCVLLRALEPIAGLEAMAHNRSLNFPSSPDEKFLRNLTSGPSRLCQALALTRAAHNGLDFSSPNSPLQILDDNFAPAKALVTSRIGIKEAVHWPLRFALPGHSCVSGKRNLTGKLIPIR